MTRLPTRCDLLALLATVLAVLAVLATACDDDGDTSDADPSAPDPSETPTLTAGDTLDLPCDSPVLMPASSWQRSEREPGRFVVRERGRHVWTCVELGQRGELDVVPGALAALDWSHLPRAVPVGKSVDLTPRGLDVLGNVVDPQAVAEAGWQLVDGADGQTIGSEGAARRRFTEPGLVELRARSGDGALEVVHELIVDAGPPVVELEAPARGTILAQRAATGVRVAGRVIEDGPDVELYIGDRRAELDADGHFDVLVAPPAAGLSVLTWRAVDQLGQSTAGSRAVLYGPPRDPSRGLERAARVHVPTWLLDDDDTSDIDDIATALEILLGRPKIDSQRISFGCNGHVVLRNIRARVDDVDLVPTQHGLDANVRLTDVSVDISGEACACAFGNSVGCVSASGSVATERVEVAVDTRVGSPGPTDIAATDARVSLSPLRIHWDFLWGGLDWAIELFEAEIREEIVSSMRDTLRSMVQANLQSTLDTFVPAQTLQLPPPLDDEITLRTRLSSISPSPDGLTVDIEATAVSRAGRGASGARTVRASGMPPSLPAGELGVAVSLDVVNDALYSLYARGAFEELVVDLVELGAAKPGSGQGELVLTASLPPMLLPGRRDGSLQLVIGDLHVLTELGFETVELFVSLAVEVVPAIDEASNTLTLRLVRDGLEVNFEAASREDAITLSGTLDDLSALIHTVVARTLVGRSMAIALPVLDLSLIPGMPPERSGALQLADARFDVSRTGYLVVTGRVRERRPR